MNNKYYCEYCSFQTNKCSTFNDHLLSKKHHINQNNIQLYYCYQCNINFTMNAHYKTHLIKIHQIDKSTLYKSYYLIDLPKKNKLKQKLDINHLIYD